MGSVPGVPRIVERGPRGRGALGLVVCGAGIALIIDADLRAFPVGCLPSGRQ